MTAPTVRSLLLLLLASGAGCGVYLPATQVLTASAVATNGAMTPLPRLSSELCQRRAELDLMQSRLDGTAKWGSDPRWSRWFDDRPSSADDKTTWAQWCQRFGAHDQLMEVSVQVLTGYVSLLQATLQTGTYNANAIRDSANAIGRGLAPVPNQGAMLAQAGALGDPLTRMVDFILKWTSERRFEHTVTDGDALVAALVTAQKRYLSALDDQARVAQRELGQIADIIDQRSEGAAPLAAAALFGWQTETARSLRLTRDRIATWSRMLDALAAGHHALADAIKAAKKDRKQKLNVSIGESTKAQLELNWLHETIAQGGP